MTSLAIEPYSQLPVITSGKTDSSLVKLDFDSAAGSTERMSFLCRAMFCSGLRESHEERVEIKGLDSGTMRSLLEYTYTSWALITNSNVQRILEAASQFQVKLQLLTPNQFTLHNLYLALTEFPVILEHVISSNFFFSQIDRQERQKVLHNYLCRVGYDFTCVHLFRGRLVGLSPG